MSVLLHICCAPCSIMCIKSLREEGLQPVGYWYNPNIHPKLEYKTRRNTLVEYAKTIDLPLILEDEYGLRSFVRDLCPDFDNRCEYCYRRRMAQTAAYAAENGFDAFCTTLLISPYQNQELLLSVGEEMASQYGIPFLYRDFRPLFKEGQQAAQDLELYRQKYCGCIFSEEERYTNHKKKKGS